MTVLLDRLIHPIRRVMALTRFRAFDVSTEVGRSHERHRRIVLTAIASVAARGVGILTTLVVVPLTVGFLGDERYGMWMAISSIIAMLGFADLGLGNGLLNAIAEAYGRDDRDMARRYVSSAFVMLTAVALLLTAVFVIVYRLIDWPGAFNVSTALARAEAGPAMAVFIGCFVINLPLSIVNRVQLGCQEGFEANLWTAGGSLLGLAAVLIAVKAQAGLAWLVLAMAGAPAAAALLNAIVVGLRRPWIIPRWRDFHFSTAVKLLHTGILFFVLSVAMAMAFASDNFVVAQVLGAPEVTQYAVPARLFVMVISLLAIVLTPLWPAYGEAIARGDVRWIKQTLVRSLLLTLVIAGAASSVLVAGGPTILRMWVGDAVKPTADLLIALGIWSVLNALGTAVAMLLNGLNKLAGQAVLAIFLGIGGLVAKIVLTHLVGVSGVVWGTIIAYVLFIAIPFAVWVPKLLAKMGAQGFPIQPLVTSTVPRDIPSVG